MPASLAHYNNVADGSYRMANALPQQSIVPMDETTPYSRGVDRSELLSGKELQILISKAY